MTDSHQECIAEGVFDGVVEFGKHRINIQKYHHIKDTKCKENDIQYLRHCSVDIAYNTQIHVRIAATASMIRLMTVACLKFCLKDLKKLLII